MRGRNRQTGVAMQIGDIVCLPCKREIGLVMQIGDGLNEDMVYVHWTGGQFAGETEWWVISLLERV
jgi:hypothetical protein